MDIRKKAETFRRKHPLSQTQYIAYGFFVLIMVYIVLGIAATLFTYLVEFSRSIVSDSL